MSEVALKPSKKSVETYVYIAVTALGALLTVLEQFVGESHWSVKVVGGLLALGGALGFGRDRRLLKSDELKAKALVATGGKIDP